MSDRQTLSYLQRRFQHARLQPQTKFGQNFLIDLNLVELIAASAQLGPRDVVLEVGTGMGSLTGLLAAQAGHVVTVEIDHHLAELARTEFDSYENVTFLEQDALKNKNHLHPQVVETLQQLTAKIPGGRIKLVANLPYNVATPILSNLLDIEPWPTLMVATIQKELAQRITAKPGGRDYSALSVWMRAQCKCEILRILPPSVFWPRPKVDSAILSIEPQKILRKQILDRGFFHQLVRSVFLHRRKYLRSALHMAARHVAAVSCPGKSSESVSSATEKQAVDDILTQLEIAGTSRAEQLTPQQFIEIAELIHAKFPGLQDASC